ncbi:MAG: aldo/keto reductase [Bacteroidota bacterium]
MKINDKSQHQPYLPAVERYQHPQYFNRCGNSGVLLPNISLGLWHNFGHSDDLLTGQKILRTAFDRGIVHFDLANNYGPSYGAAEENFGRIYKQDFTVWRDELFISTKAGYDMWPGPYGNHGSRKYLIASLDQSLKRLGLEYVDLFYHHRPDPDTPLEETITALDHIVRSGKALYVGISNYSPAGAAEAIALLKKMGTPCLIHQGRYSLLDRGVEQGLFSVLKKEEVGFIAFSPLAQGLLTGKYLEQTPRESRAAKEMTHLNESTVQEKLPLVRSLQKIAVQRGQKLNQMAISWLLEKENVTSVLIGASSVSQLEDNLLARDSAGFSAEEIQAIENLFNPAL